MAGGSGTRFWPYSRHKAPKQLLQIFGQLEKILRLGSKKKLLVLTKIESLQNPALRTQLQGSDSLLFMFQEWMAKQSWVYFHQIISSLVPVDLKKH